MTLEKLQIHLSNFTTHFPCKIPAMGWYFSSEIPPGAITYQPDVWSCMFQNLDQLINGKPICFSGEAPGCSGAACYLGFKQTSQMAGSFLAESEKFKEKIEYGNEFYKQIKAKRAEDKYLILSRLENIDPDQAIEVINYWVSPLSLAGLVTLSNFDRPSNNNVIIPFASGCQSLWTLPYKEKDQKEPKAVIGAMDPTIRKHVPDDTLVFSVPTKRFIQLSKNIEKSFACEDNWLKLI